MRTLHERERAAYMDGDYETANLLDIAIINGYDDDELPPPADDDGEGVEWGSDA